LLDSFLQLPVVGLAGSFVELLDNAGVKEPAALLIAEEMNVHEAADVLTRSIQNPNKPFVEVLQHSLLD
jgi:hypothetical protein